MTEKLTKFIPDLSERTVLKQVYFCISGTHPCNGAGQYFIADFAFVKQLKDEFGKTIGWDVVIADAKLSAGTSLTDNQKVANGLNNLILKSIPDKVSGLDLEDFNIGLSLEKSQKILKIFSDGNGNFSDIISIP
jgi:hypothetical protein